MRMISIIKFITINIAEKINPSDFSHAVVPVIADCIKIQEQGVAYNFLYANWQQ